MNIICTLTRVLPIEQGKSQNGNEWQKLTIVAQTIEQYPKQVAFVIFGADKINAMSPLLQLGASLKVSFDLESREFNGKFYTSVNAWKIEPATQGIQSQQTASATPTNGQYQTSAPMAAAPYTQGPVPNMTPVPQAYAVGQAAQPQMGQQFQPQQQVQGQQQGKDNFPF